MNRKKIIIFFSILLIIIAISGYFIIKNIKKNKEETLVQEYIPQEEIGESQARQIIFSRQGKTRNKTRGKTYWYKRNN